jgi:hypothetical protein
MNGNDRVRGIVLAAKHLLGFGGFDLLLEHIERLLQVGGDLLAALCPLEQDTDVVNLLGKAVAEFEILSQATLALQGLLRFGLVVPEVRGRDFLFELC